LKFSAPKKRLIRVTAALWIDFNRRDFRQKIKKAAHGRRLAYGQEIRKKKIKLKGGNESD
jgi:hypothetical protein